MKLSYTSRAKFDIELAFSWYEHQQRGLGLKFLNCVETGTQSIIQNPKMYRVCYSKFRRCLIKRFPFSIFYTIEKDILIIHSVFNNRQKPDKRP